MRRSRQNRLVLAALGLLLLGLGGIAGWWLAMRAMPIEQVGSSRTAAAQRRMTDMPGMEMEGTDGMSGMAGMGGGAGADTAQTRDGVGEPGPRGGAELVHVDPVRLQRIGVRYAVARRERFGRSVRAEASVAYNEEEKASVTEKIAGWVERLYVDKPGQPVRRGQPLLEIYSPELVSTQRELLLALEHRARGESAADTSPAGRAHADRAGADALSPQSLVDAARRRLELWGVPKSEIERLIRTREVRRTLTLTAPAGGVVVEKNVLEGARVEPGDNLYMIADLTTVWVEARVFEMDLARIRVGQSAKISLPAYPGEAFSGTVSFIYPYLDTSTRTVAVRLEVANPAGRLKPGMFATVVFEPPADQEAMVVPASAVIETGERAFVLVKRGEGLFEPREVEIGERSGEKISIVENLAAGDTVVASANFLIDAEANLMAYMGGMLGMGMRADQMRMDTQGMEGMEEMPGMDGTDRMEGMEDMQEMEGTDRMEEMRGMDDMEGMSEKARTKQMDRNSDATGGRRDRE